MTHFYDVGSGNEKQFHICLTTNENSFTHRWATEADKKKYRKEYIIYFENLRVVEVDKKRKKIKSLKVEIINAHKQIETQEEGIKKLETQNP